jgi:putative transcriptional regulator
MGTEQLRTTLKVHRAMHDLTQADLAERVGITRKSINAIETGKMVPSTLLALKLARALRVPVETLFYLETEVS